MNESARHPESETVDAALIGYFDGSLTAAARAEFERRLTGDAALAEQFEAMARAHRTVTEFATFAAMPSDFADSVMARLPEELAADDPIAIERERVAERAMLTYAELAQLPDDFADGVVESASVVAESGEDELVAERAMTMLFSHASMGESIADRVLAALPPEVEDADAAAEHEATAERAMTTFTALAALPKNFATRVLERLPAMRVLAGGAARNAQVGEVVPATGDITRRIRRVRAIRSARSVVAAAAVVLVVVAVAFRVANWVDDSTWSVNSANVALGNANPNANPNTNAAGSNATTENNAPAPDAFTPAYTVVAGQARYDEIAKRLVVHGEKPAVVLVPTISGAAGMDSIPATFVMTPGASAEISRHGKGQLLTLWDGAACVTPERAQTNAGGTAPVATPTVVMSAAGRWIEIAQGPVMLSISGNGVTLERNVDIDVFGGHALIGGTDWHELTQQFGQWTAVTSGNRARWTLGHFDADSLKPILEALQTRLLPLWAALGRAAELMRRLGEDARFHGVDPRELDLFASSELDPALVQLRLPEVWADPMARLGSLPPAREILDSISERVVMRTMTAPDVDKLAEFMGRLIEQGAPEESVKDMVEAYLEVLDEPTPDAWRRLIKRIGEIFESAMRRYHDEHGDSGTAPQWPSFGGENPWQRWTEADGQWQDWDEEAWHDHIRQYFEQRCGEARD